MTHVLLRCLLALLLLGIPAAVRGAEHAAAPIVLKIASAEPSGSPLGQMLTALSAHLRDTAHGDIEVKVMPSGVLGTERETLQRTMDGGLQAYAGSLETLAEVVPELQVLLAPMAFRSLRQADRALDASLARELPPLLAAKGLQLGAWGPSDLRVMYTRKPLARASDAKGMRVPGTTSAARALLYSKLGMIAGEPMPASAWVRRDAGDAFDAMDATLFEAAGTSLDRHFSHVTLTHHALATQVLVYSTRWLDGLPEQLRETLQALPSELTTRARSELRAMHPRLRERLAQLRVNVHEPTRAQARSFSQALRNCARDVARDAGPAAQRLLRATR